MSESDQSNTRSAIDAWWRVPRPLIMGVLNVTPDSFSDGGRFVARDQAVQRAQRLVELGADIIDIGGESTRPGARPVSADEECRRVVPVVEALAPMQLAPISVDTSQPQVMREAVRVGAAMINDVRALQRPGALDCVRELAVPVCLMHMQGQPDTMQDAPSYTDPVAEVIEFLRARAEACKQAGIAAERVILDPGFGFGKRLGDNLALLRQLSRITALGYPVLAGLSRKSMIGALTGRPVDQRLIGSVILATLAVQNGASIVRVHDVAETREALTILQAVTSDVSPAGTEKQA